jgi:ABC-type uncharacterized transport system involved in gliding motility auxiliary subunit
MKKPSKLLLGLGLGIIVTAFVARLLLAEWVDSTIGLIIIGLFCAIASVFMDLDFWKEVASMKTTKNGLSLGAVVGMVFVLLIAVNYIGQARNVKWDLTADKLNSLSDQTLTILKNSPAEIEFRGFFRVGVNDLEDRMKDSFENLVKMYQAESPKVKLFVYDPFKRKDLTEKYKVMTTGEIVVSIGEKQTTVNDVSEQAFTNAIVKLTRNTKNLYSIIGHGERDLEDTGPRGTSQLKSYLVDEGYKISDLSLATSGGKLPDDAAAVIIVGPTQNYTEGELKVIRDFLTKGGKLLLALDPGSSSNAIKLSQDVGIEFYNQFVQDSYGRLLMKSANFALGLQYSGTHEVTSKIKKVQTIFNSASPLRRSPGAFTGITTDDLVMTEQSAYIVKQLTEGEDTDKPPKQQFTLAMAAKGKLNEAAPNEFAAVVVGDSDFLSNETIDVLGANRDLALNIMASLSNDAEMITIRPKFAQGTPMVLTSAQNGGLFGLICLIPMSMFAFSFIAWWRRRGA